MNTPAIEYLPLPDSYRDHSLTFRLVKRTGDVAMFAAWAEGREPWEWEVFVVQKQKATVFPSGKSHPAKEKVPSPEEWGKGAESRFDMLVRDRQEGPSPVSPQ